MNTPLHIWLNYLLSEILSRYDNYRESKVATGYITEGNLLRLFRNKGYYFEGKIHETVYNSIKTDGGRIYNTDFIIHHFGALDKERLLRKKEIYITLLKDRLEKKDFQEKAEDYIYFELARELLNSGDMDGAIQNFEKALADVLHEIYDEYGIRVREACIAAAGMISDDGKHCIP